MSRRNPFTTRDKRSSPKIKENSRWSGLIGEDSGGSGNNAFLGGSKEKGWGDRGKFNDNNTNQRRNRDVPNETGPGRFSRFTNKYNEPSGIKKSKREFNLSEMADNEFPSLS